MIEPGTILETIKAGERLLAEKGIETARIDAEILLAHVRQCGRMALFGAGQEMVQAEERQTFEALIKRRLTLEPVAYLTGEQEFWSLPFKVTPDTLIPRPDTETLIEAVLRELDCHRPLHLLDLGTGTGCILLSLLSEMKVATGVGVDISPAALEVAVGNAASLGLSDRARFIQSNWFEAFDSQADQFDVILSNPPYIPTADIEGLMHDVRDYEPLGALDGGDDGLDPYRLITKLGPSFLKPGGLIAVEVGIDQATEVDRLFTEAGLANISTFKDLGGIDRVVVGKKS